MSPSTALRSQLVEARGLPFGVARSALIERVVDEADALGEDVLAVEARLELMASYAYGGEPVKRFPLFARLVATYDADPARFVGSSRHYLFWYFKWVTVGAVSYPGVPLAQIEQGLADMETRYRDAGEGLGPFLGCRYDVDAHVHGVVAARKAYLAWIRAPRTQLSDCQACEPTRRAQYLGASGRCAEAVAEVEDVLGRGGCSEQPQSAIAYVLEPLIRVGSLERAAAEHLRGVRIMRSRVGETSLWARHVRMLARSGHLSRGLDLLEDRLREVDAPPSPEGGMWLAAAGARLLRGIVDGGRGDLAVAVPSADDGSPVPVPASELAERLAATARDLAAQFDGRNGTGAIGQEVQSWLDADELPPLPLDGLISRRGPLASHGDRGRADPVAPATDGAAATDGALAADAADLIRLLEDARVTQSAALRHDVLSQWRARRAALCPGAGPLHAARLDATIAVDDVLAGSADVTVLVAAAERLRGLDDHERAVTCDLLTLRMHLESGSEPDAAGAMTRLDDLTQELDRHCTPGAVGSASGMICSVLQAAVDRSVLDPSFAAARLDEVRRRGLALLEAVDPQELTPEERGSLALLIAWDVVGTPTATRQDRLAAAWSLLPAGLRARDRAVVGLEFAQALLDGGDGGDGGDGDGGGDLTAALDVLAEVIRDAGTCAEPLLAARAHATTALVRRHRGEDAEAVADLLLADRLLHATPEPPGGTGHRSVGDPEEIAAVRRDLAFALLAAGRVTEAAEVAETAVRALEDHLGAAGIGPDLEPPDVDLADLVHGRVPPVVPDPAGPSVARIAGTLSYAAAETCADAGEDERALVHARRSAAWHRVTGWTGAEAEALMLAGRTEPDPEAGLRHHLLAAARWDADGEWRAAGRNRRMAAGRAAEAGLLPLALEVLDVAGTAVDAQAASETEADVVRWERTTLDLARARVLLRCGRPAEAMPVADGLGSVYRELGDLDSAWGTLMVRVDCLEALDRAEEALPDLQDAAEAALAAGSRPQARWLGNRLAVLLDDLGRPDEAEAVWERFSQETG